MLFINQLLIFTGLVLQIFNFCIDLRFIHKNLNAVTNDSGKTRTLDYIVWFLILLFCVVYLIILSLSIDSIWVGILLLAGAIFVTIVLFWIFSLLDASKDSAMAISETLIGIIEARDPNLNGHSLHVGELAMLIYDYVPPQLKKDINAENLRYAALFHDVGKLGVPESILNKPGKLNKEEWDVMRTHPAISVQILKPLKSFDYIKDWILYHHERIDGNGYFEIPGNQIPFAAKIISVADTYSAISMKRSYKPAKSYEESIALLKEASGTQLDSFLVDLFCAIPKAQVIDCERRVHEKMTHSEQQTENEVKYEKNT